MEGWTLPFFHPSIPTSTNPHFSRPVRNAHRVPTFVGVSRESFRPGKPHPKRLATGDLLTNRRICEKVRLAQGWPAKITRSKKPHHQAPFSTSAILVL